MRCNNCGQYVDHPSDHIDGEFEDPSVWWYECPEDPGYHFDRERKEREEEEENRRAGG
jgi:hypothetical protein